MLKKLSLLALVAAGSISANAATTGTLQLNGQVGLDCSIGVTPTAKAQSLDLVGGEAGTKIADITESCNNETGYDVSIVSANDRQLRTVADGSGQNVNFELAYAGASYEGDATYNASRDSAQFDVVNPLNITLAGNANAIRGSYSDTLTVTIASK